MRVTVRAAVQLEIASPRSEVAGPVHSGSGPAAAPTNIGPTTLTVLAHTWAVILLTAAVTVTGTVSDVVSAPPAP
jgi:hypothetical protein